MATFWTNVSQMRARSAPFAAAAAPLTTTSLPPAQMAPTVPTESTAVKRGRGFPKGQKRAPQKLGVDAPANAPKRNSFPVVKDAKPGSGLKKGLPTVSHDVGIALDSYGNIDAIEKQLHAYRQARQLMRRGYFTSDSVNVLAKPGSLGAPTVGTRSDAKNESAAAVSANPNLIGQTEASPDPLQEAHDKFVSKTTTAAAVAPSTVGRGIVPQGEGDSVPTSQTPAQVAQLADDKQLPSRVSYEQEEAVAVKSLFRRK